MEKKLGFALGSGGSRGVVHIGFLKAMDEEGIRPDFITGCSMGSVVGACYALGMTPDEMRKEIEALKFVDIFDMSINPLRNAALLRSRKMRKKLETYYKNYTFDDVKIPFACVATNLVDGETVTLKEGSVLDAVVASSSIPGIFRPVEYGECLLIDGGVKCRIPVDQLRDMGADVVVAIDALGKVRTVKKKFNMLSVLFRMVDIVDGELTGYKLERQNPDIYLEPDLADMVQYKFKGMTEAMDIGYELGKSRAADIKALLG